MSDEAELREAFSNVPDVKGESPRRGEVERVTAVPPLCETEPTRGTGPARARLNGQRSLTCQQLEGIVSATRDAVITIDEDQQIRLFNLAAERMFGCHAEEAISQPLGRFIPERFRDAQREHVRAFGKSDPTAGPMGNLGSAVGLRADGEEFPVEASVSRLSDEGTTLYMVILRDLTERERAQQRLKEQQASLRTLAAQVAVAEERERQRIAIGLHDDLGQTLTVVKLTVSALLESQPEANVSSELRHLSMLLDQAIQATRSLIFELGSSLLHELGLEAALQSLGEQLESRHDMHFIFDSDHQVPALPDDTSTVLFRIVRELLFNVEKHAHARNVRVTVNRVGEQVCIAVQDDGMGFDLPSTGAGLSPSEGFGLPSICAQGISIGGRVEIKSQPGRGTRVMVHAPLA